MSEEEIFILVQKELSGEISFEEAQALKVWMKKPGNEQLYQEIKKIWDISGQMESAYQPDTESSWQQIAFKLQNDNRKKGSKVIQWPSLAKMAAALALIAGVAYVLTLWLSNTGWVERHSGAGQISMFLPDSTKIWLNKNSVVKYSPSFNENEREVYLTGEAFFEVKRNEEKPFVIYSGAARTQVLGTSFNLEAYENDEAIELIVMEGKVSFGPVEYPSNAVLLEPGYKASYSKKNGLITKVENGDNNFIAWKDKRLVFRGTELKQVFTILEDYFEVEFKVENDAILNCQFTSTFDHPQLKEVLEVIALATNISFTKEKNTYIISGLGCDPGI